MLWMFDTSGHNERRSRQLDYDDRGRLTSIVDHWGDEVDSDRYEYDCR
jgi:YD repeat-containing protein